jgi:hypothetical protein
MKKLTLIFNVDFQFTHDSDLTKLPSDQVPGPLIHVAFRQRSRQTKAARARAKHRKGPDENPPLGPKPDE